MDKKKLIHDSEGHGACPKCHMSITAKEEKAFRRQAVIKFLRKKRII